MATHIDFNAVSDGAGTFADPRNVLPTFASDNDYYIKRGNSEILPGANTRFNGISNVTFGAYYDDGGSAAYDDNTALAKPILTMYFTSTSTGAWVEVGTTDVYEYTHGTLEWSPHFVLGLTTLGDRGSDSWPDRANYYGGQPGRTSGLAAFTAAGQWDSTVGSGSVAPKVAIYSPAGNPATVYTTIYMCKGTDRFAIINTSSNITVENLNFKYFYAGFTIDALGTHANSNCTLRNLEIDHCWFGINISATLATGSNSDHNIYNNYIYDSGSVGIRAFQNCAGTEIFENHIYRTGKAASIGGIYGTIVGTSPKPVLIYDNYVDTVYTDDTYWEFEFRCYYAEQSSEYVTWSRNYGKNAAGAGLCSNGPANGGGPVTFESNLIEDCDRGITDSDSINEDNGTSIWINNTFNRVRSGVGATRSASATATSIIINNNIFISDGGIGTGIQVSTDLQSLGGLVENHNIFYGFSTDTGNHTLGANTLLIDPQLDSNHKLQGNSPCIGAGVQPLSLTDYNGDTRKSNAGFDIGAVWFDGPSDTTVERLLASGGTK